MKTIEGGNSPGALDQASVGALFRDGSETCACSDLVLIDLLGFILLSLIIEVPFVWGPLQKDV